MPDSRYPNTQPAGATRAPGGGIVLSWDRHPAGDGRETTMETLGDKRYMQRAERSDTASLFGRTMWLVAATAGMFTLGAFVARDISGGMAIVAWLASLACLIAMNWAVRQSDGATLALLFGFGFLIGAALAPTVAFYAEASPQAVWQAGGATALFVAACGTFGYSTSRDLSGLGRVLTWALLALIVLGIVLVFVSIPQASVVYAILGLAIFGGLTMVDFQRLRTSRGIDSAPMMAASIFLDILNIFTFFLSVFGGRRD